MTPLEQAQQIVAECDKSVEELNLRRLKLTVNDLQRLIPEIQKLPNLRILFLDQNELTELPSEIGLLTNLEELCLTGNELRTLPSEIGELKKLKYLDLSYNKLTTLPSEIGELQKLGYLDLMENQLTTLPPEIGDLIELECLDLMRNELETVPHDIIRLINLSTLDLDNNPLAIETLLFLQNDLSEELFVYTNRSNNLALVLFTETLEKLYSTEEAKQKEQQICALAGKKNTYINHHTNKENLTGTEVLIDFLSRENLFKSADPNDWIKFITKKILHTILSNETENEEKANAIAKLNVALGNCNTPVVNYLMTELLAEYQGKNENDLPKHIANYVLREALESYVAEKLEFASKNEQIEQVQGLLNSVFLEDAENHPLNRLKIDGERPRLPAKTEHIDVSFAILADNTIAQFANLICKPNENDNLTRNNQERYELDPIKLKSIQEKYFAAYGILSMREQLIKEYSPQLQQLLLYSANEKVKEMFGSDFLDLNVGTEDTALFDSNLQISTLRQNLSKETDENIKHVALEFFNDLKTRVDARYSAFEEQKKPAAIAVTQEPRAHQLSISGFVRPTNSLYQQKQGQGKRKRIDKNDKSRQRKR